MKISATAAAQLYPHLVKVECELHNEQTRAKVPSHLKAVFANRDDPSMVCKGCLDDANKQWDAEQQAMRQRKADEKAAAREAIVQLRKDAVASDDKIGDHINVCKAAEDRVKKVEQALADTRSNLHKKRVAAENLAAQIKQLQDTYKTMASDIFDLGEYASAQFENLEKADEAVTSCYNDLRECVSKSEHLWGSVGKSVRKKRNKTNRKEAIALLRAHNVAGGNEDEVDR